MWESVSKGICKVDLCKSIIESFLLHRMLASKTIEFGLLTYGSSDTCVEEIEIRKPSLDTLKDIQSIGGHKDIQGDVQGGTDRVYMGIHAAHKIVTETNSGKKFNRVIVLFTDAESELANDNNTRSIAEDLKSNECIVYIVLIIDKLKQSSLTSQISRFRDFANDVGGYLTVTNDLAGAMGFLSSGPGMGTRPTQSKIAFELSPDFKIPCFYCSKTSKVPLPSLKKQSNASYDVDMPDSGKVSMSTMYRNPSDPDEELEFEDRVKGYKYGPQYIPFGGMDDDVLKLSSPPVVRLLGFLPANRVPRYHFLDVCFVLGPNPSTPEGEGAGRVIAALSRAMRKLDQVALARFVKRENSDPWLVAIMPKPDSEGGRDDRALVMHRLPCAEDLRNFIFPPLSMDGVTAEQTRAVSSAIDAMTIPSALSPEGLLMFNPSSLAVLSRIQQRAGVSSSCLTGVLGFDDTFSSMGDVPEISMLWRTVREHCELLPRDNSEKGRKRKVFWADVDIGEDVNKTIKQEQSESKTNVEPLPSPLNEGSVNPTEEFTVLLKTFAEEKDNDRTDELRHIIVESLSALRRIVDLLVTTGGTSAHYRKALACIKCMREGSIQVREHDAFNQYMRDTIKRKFSVGRHFKFWESIRSDGVTLISSEDTAQVCSVTAAEARDFLAEEKIVDVAPNIETKEEDQDEDDLFDNMM